MDKALNLGFHHLEPKLEGNQGYGFELTLYPIGFEGCNQSMYFLYPITCNHDHFRGFQLANRHLQDQCFPLRLPPSVQVDRDRVQDLESTTDLQRSTSPPD